jgi:hypothetical protein
MEAMIEAANRAGEYVGGDEFVGVELKVVQDRPNDQAAT